VRLLAARGALAPRALFMTLLLRLAGSDLFIHGAGGMRYDRITERLARTWLDETLAPMTLATATLTLPLLDRPAPSRADVAHAAWLAHRALHDPGVIGDEEAARRKAERRARIDALPRRSPERAAAFRAMHDDLAETRERRADAIRALRERAEGTAAAFLDSRVALDREWAFPLHPPEALGVMRSSIERAFGAEVSAPPRT